MKSLRETQLFPSIFVRRIIFSSLVIVTIAVMLYLMVQTLAPGGLSVTDLVMIVLFGITLPWLAVGFWNAIIGFLLMRLSKDPVSAVLPAFKFIQEDAPITQSTALLVCIRNEDAARIATQLELSLASLFEQGVADKFHLYILSDSNDAALFAQEQAVFDTLTHDWAGRINITYRRREVNTGFKAGNVEDFCQRWGSEHTFAIVLDADSLMTASAMLRLVRVMQANPQIGILQGLVVGMPASSAFTRTFQFGMRLGMRSYTLGSAWWQADCGPYWGHNAVLRLEPFTKYCKLPLLSGSGESAVHILSHDQVEAVMMRRAGFEVRVFPQEDENWEQNPPTMVEFVRRDLRWCEGNMQYFRLLGMPGLRLTSRAQLLLAILMFIGAPAWIGMFILGTLMVAMATEPASLIDPLWGRALFAVVVLAQFLPKIASALEVLLNRKLRQSFGGAAHFILGVLIESLFSILILPVMWFEQTVFLMRLLAGRKSGWTAQIRANYSVPLSQAFRAFWMETLTGIILMGVLIYCAPGAWAYISYLLLGLVLSVPLTILSADPAVGRYFVRKGIAALPEEIAPPPAMIALNLPALNLPRDFRSSRIS